jgi:hypothetical protein
VPAVAVPAVAVSSGSRESRDSGSAAWRQRATSPSPSVWPLMAADRPMRTGLKRRLQARQSRSRPGRSTARRARWRWQQRAGCWAAVAVCFSASTRNGGLTSAQGLQVEAMRARLEPGAGVACTRARPASVASSSPVRGGWEAGFAVSASHPGSAPLLSLTRSWPRSSRRVRVAAAAVAAAAALLRPCRYLNIKRR